MISVSSFNILSPPPQLSCEHLHLCACSTWCVSIFSAVYIKLDLFAGRFVNHSCEPNCEMQKWSVNGLFRMALFALREIQPHEELSYDYNFSLFNPAEGQVFHSDQEVLAFHLCVILTYLQFLISQCQRTELWGHAAFYHLRFKYNKLIKGEGTS